MEQHLGVAGRLEHVTVRLELTAQLDVVVDLPVEDTRETPGEMHGLVAAYVHVEHREATAAEPGARPTPRAVGVRSAMRDEPERLVEDLLSWEFRRNEGEDAAHG